MERSPNLLAPFLLLADRLGIDRDNLAAGTTSYDILNETLPGPGVCSPSLKTNTACFTYATQISSIEAVIEIKRSVADLAYPIDPRNWATCVQGPFTKSVEIVTDSNGVPIKQNGQYVEEKNGAPLGTTWTGTLLEIFALPFVTFENILSIDLKVTAADILLSYKQRNNVTFLGVKRPGLLELNEGFTQATTDGGVNTVVSGNKQIRFGKLPKLEENAQLNYIAPALLTLWQSNSNHFGLCC